jgi:dihydrofolate reductase
MSDTMSLVARLLYITPTSLDGYIGDGDYDWSPPGEEELAFINDVMRPIGTHLYGRKLYETMAVWETPEVLPSLTPATLDFAQIWQTAEKIVCSRSLQSVSTAKTRLEGEFDPQMVRNLKGDVLVGGPNLAAQAMRSGLVDEVHLFVVPMILGGGIPIFPTDLRIKLELVDERRFGEGWVYLRYRTR